jgi:hypothetical protein
MAMSFVQRKGDCPACPEVGHELHKILYLDAVDIDAQIEDKVRNAYPCSRYVAEGKVRIDAVQHEVKTESNGLGVAVGYTNLITGERQNATYQT